MDNKENIIQIKDRLGNDMAKLAFADFMAKTECHFNELSRNNPMLFKKCSPSQLEEQTESVLKEIAPSTPFRPEEIKLVSGHSFPDVIAEKFFGVEVKSTKENHWTSTGSSIVENTRNNLVENIYMLFGKLGGTPPEFKCRPYEDCLYQIAVTHSPRYLIDMELREKKQQTIFDKLETTYDVFRKDDNKIERVRDYYVRQSLLSGKNEMPWWVGRKTLSSNEEDETPMISLFNEKNAHDKLFLVAQMFVLFPEVIEGKYEKAALWLCTHKYLLCLNVRDIFSAGGQVKRHNGEILKTPYPRVLKTIIESMPLIKEFLQSDVDIDILEIRPEYYEGNNAYVFWLSRVVEIFNNLTYSVGSGKNKRTVHFKDLNIDIKDWLEHPDKHILLQTV